MPKKPRVTLVPLHKVDALLANTDDLQDILKIRDVAVGASVVAKAQKDFELAQQAKVIQFKSERAAGRWLETNVDHNGGGDRKSLSQKERVNRDLPDGIDHNESYRWQLLAKIPEDEFIDYIDDKLAKGKELYATALYEIARNHVRKQEKVDLIQMAKRHIAETREREPVGVADIKELSLPEACADMVFTDPPYDEDSVGLYYYLAKLAAVALKPGGYLMTYTGKMFLPTVMNMLGEYLEYVWEYGVFQPDSNHKIMRLHLFQAWRPILCYKKPGVTEKMAWQPDMIKGTRDKTFHEWQQQIEPPMKWIEAYTEPGDTVIDPFCGGGTTLVACDKLSRRYFGYDIDPDAVAVAKMRLEEGRVRKYG